MVLAIVRKELRETWAFAALALGLYLVFVGKLTGKASPLLTPIFRWVPGINVEQPDVPFVADSFLAMYLFIGATLAIALGFRQSAWEPSQGTALYLLHVPLARQTIFLTKLVTGIGLLLLCTLLPILIYAAWAAMPGTHPGPFEWMMTGPALAGLASHAACVSRGIRQRPSPGTVVRLAAAAAGCGRTSRHRLVYSPALVADRFPPALARRGGARQRYPLGSRNARFLKVALKHSDWRRSLPVTSRPPLARRGGRTPPSVPGSRRAARRGAAPGFAGAWRRRGRRRRPG